MDYDSLASMFLSPVAYTLPTPVTSDTPARRLRDALEPLATQGWWSRPVGERLGALGLTSFAGYVWGRSAPLGTPDPAVVVAAFGLFDPALLTQHFLTASGSVSRGAILAARAEGAAEAVGLIVPAADAERLARPLLRALDQVGCAGRPLFAGVRALPVPPNPAGRLWRAAEMVREHRGDGHLAALAAAGVDAVEANVLTELWLGYPLGEYTATRGFSTECIASAAQRLRLRGWMEGDELTSVGRSARLGIEEMTDRTQARLIEALGAGLEPIIAGSAAVSKRLVDRGWFPQDPRKRAAG